MVTKIEKMLLQLEPQFKAQLQGYLEYLLFLQQQKQKQKSVANSKNASVQHITLENLKCFKGDAPFPHVNISKADIYIPIE